MLKSTDESMALFASSIMVVYADSMVKSHTAIIPKNILRLPASQRSQDPVSAALLEAASKDVEALYTLLTSCPTGLSTAEAERRLKEYGPNVLAKDQRPGLAVLLLHAILNPLVILLAVLSIVSLITGDYRASSMMVLMIVIGVSLKLVQEAKADQAAAKLKAMISVKATAIRDGLPSEIQVSRLVPGDVVLLAAGSTPYSKTDEVDLILNGYVAFLDPPKETAKLAIKALEERGVQVKVITGDNDLVAKKICKEVGIATEQVLVGSEVESMSDQQLAEACLGTTLFARVSPAHKQRIIKALQSKQHTVGFMGDGINDAAALRTADVGISVDSAVDIAKESADMILLEKSLLVLESGVVEGRKVFANILKYVRMGASSNFGNMLSVLGASAFVPFLPMAPIQILANNLLYDLSQTAIPTDDVDADQIQKPRPWDIRQLTRFILCIGPCSSLFDYTTYFMMLYVFHCWNTATPEAAIHSASLFQTGWFVESLLTQTLIIHIIRTNKIPFLQSRSSWPMAFMSLWVISIGIALPFSPLGSYLGFSPLPLLYWPLLAITLLAYALLTQWIKVWLLRRNWI